MEMMRLNERRAKILHKLYTQKVSPGTIKDIARQLEGVNYNLNDTYSFLCLMTKIKSPVLEVNGTVMKGGKPFPIYKVNKKSLTKLWTETIYYALSESIYEDEHLVIV